MHFFNYSLPPVVKKTFIQDFQEIMKHNFWMSLKNLESMSLQNFPSSWSIFKYLLIEISCNVNIFSEDSYIRKRISSCCSTRYKRWGFLFKDELDVIPTICFGPVCVQMDRINALWKKYIVYNTEETFV